MEVERGTGEARQVALHAAKAQAAQVMRAACGSVEAKPISYACISRQWLESSGGDGTVAKFHGHYILLSERGMNWHFIVHERSHAAMFERLGLLA